MGWVCLLTLLVVALAPVAAEARVVLDEGGQLSIPRSSGGRLDVEDPAEVARRIDTEILPIPQEAQPPLSAYRSRGQGGWSQFREPFPQVPVWDPLGPKRVGLQAGHWEYREAPEELADLRSNPGTSGGGKAEWEVNLDIAERTAVLLREAGVEVDILPTTIPVRYRAHAFVSIHADGDVSGVLNGYKVGRSGWSGTPEVDDTFVELLSQEYGAVTGLPRRDEQVSLRMRWYYSFNARRYQHAVAPGVPQTIIETGFLTNASDRRMLIGDPDLVARGIAQGVLKFLQRDSLREE